MRTYLLKFSFILTLVVIMCTANSKAQRFIQSELDTVQMTAMLQQEEFLDSMLNQWYIKRSLKNGTLAKVKADTAIRNLPDSIYKARLKNIVSPIPMTYNPQVQRWINMYVARNRRTPYIIGMTEYYFPIIESIFSEYDVPQELKYLAIIESALNPKARSRAGAVGLWQFIYSTGKMYDLEINSYVDDRSDPILATHAAARFLGDMYGMYGDWTLVLAAYNCGPGNVNKAIRRSGGKTNFWEIYDYLPRETRGYVPAFIAANYFMTYYKEHNIQPIKVELSLVTDTLMVEKKVHLMQIAEVLNISVDELRYMNPQYKKDIIPAAEGRPYSVRLPMLQSLAFIDRADSIYAYKDSVFFDKRYVAYKQPKHKYSKYGKKRSYSGNNNRRTTSSAPSYEPVSVKGKTKIFYTVKTGDTYGFIASWHNVRVSDVKYWNNAYSNRLKSGQKLAIYVPASRKNFYAQLDKMSFEKKQALKGKRKSKTSTKGGGTKQISKPTDNRYVWYQVKSGDNLWEIARRFPGTSDKDIKKINSFSNRDLQTLQAGQYIKIKQR